MSIKEEIKKVINDFIEADKTTQILLGNKDSLKIWLATYDVF